MGDFHKKWIEQCEAARLSHIANVAPDVLKAVEFSEKLGDLRQRRKKANALLRFCSDLARIALAVKGVKL